MSADTAPNPRYALRPLFLIAALFILAAPLFWMELQRHPVERTDIEVSAPFYEYTYPTLHYAFGRLRSGEIPWWNPTQWCGAPMTADPRFSIFQPLHAPFLWLSTERAMAVHAWLCLVLMGGFFALAARGLGVTYVPALLGALVYTFSGAVAAAIDRPAAASALVWAPLLFWAAGEFLRTARLRMAVLTGLALGCLILTGANSLLVAFLVVFTILLVVRFVTGMTPRRSPSRLFAGLAIAPLIALTLSAVYWMPLLRWAPHLDSPFAAMWSVDLALRKPANIVELAAQGLASHPGSAPRAGYVGIASLLLASAAMARKTTRTFAGAGVLVIVLCASASTLPVSTFPTTVFLYPGVFTVALLVALGADVLFTRDESRRVPGIWPASLIVAVVAILLFVLASGLVRGYLLAAAVLIVPAIVARHHAVAGAFGLALALLLVIDLSGASENHGAHPYFDGPPPRPQFADTLDAIEEESLGTRAALLTDYAATGMPTSLGMLSGVDIANGAGPPLLHSTAAWWRVSEEIPLSSAVPDTDVANVIVARHQILAAAAGRIIVTHTSDAWPDQLSEPLRLLRQDGSVHVWLNESALPRAYWVPEGRVASSASEARSMLVEEGFDLERTCLVEEPLAGVSSQASPGADHAEPGLTYRDAQCRMTTVTPRRIVLEVKAPADGITVLSDTYAPGWSVKVDGAPRTIVRANGLFRAVATSAGEHTIEFTYDPFVERTGLAVSLLTGALLLLGALAMLLRGA